MRISYLELKNYRRFRELRLQFPDGIVGILGLNGAGKTTIIEAVAWALFGNVDEIVRTNKESIRRLGTRTSDSVSATVEFEMEGTEYRLEREMGGKNLSMKVSLSTRGEKLAEGDRAVKTMVQRLLGMDHKSFFTSVFARQKELNELQNHAPSERKKIVLRMLRIDTIDSALQSVREDMRSATDTVRGMMTALVDSEGREKEPILERRVEDLGKVKEAADEKVKETSARVTACESQLEETRARRNSLNKDVAAYNAAAADLKARRATVSEKTASEKRLVESIADIEKRLSELPRLEASEKEWTSVSERKDAIESEKTKHEKRTHLMDNISDIKQEVTQRSSEIDEMTKSRPDVKEIGRRIEEADEGLAECERRRSELAKETGQLNARLADKRASQAADRERLDEVRKAGEDGTCPTCERKLEGTYQLLMSKLEEDVASAEKAAKDLAAEMERVHSENEALGRKMQALEKRKAHHQQLLIDARKAETKLEGARTELGKRKEALAKQERALKEVGEVDFSPEEYERIRASVQRLKVEHDEYIRLRGKKDQLARETDDLRALRESIEQLKVQEGNLRGLVDKLEPNKDLYSKCLLEFDSESNMLNEARDSSRNARAELEKAVSEIESTSRELNEVRRMKRSADDTRRIAEELALLEETVAAFRSHLIGKIAPTLAEMTSEMVDTMTDGRYNRVELDDDYQVMVEDDGVMHSLDRFSGGEADLANLGLRLAISRVIAERTGASPVNFIILDEVFGSLDPHRKRSVMTALSGLSSQFRQVMLITHVEDVRDLMGSVIRVEELPDGTSTARLVS